MRISRRKLLRAAVGAVAVGLGASVRLHAQAAEPAAKIGLAFSLYGMKSLKPAEALKACAEIGYDGVELPLMPGWPCEPKSLTRAERTEIARLLKELRLALPALMEDIHLTVDDAQHRQNVERLKAAAELAHALSPEAPPVVETVLGGKPGDWPAARARLADRLAAWAKIADESKITLAIKPHVAGAVHTPAAALELLKQVDHPRVKLTYDFSHYRLRGLDLADSLKALAPHTAFVHVKDARGDAAKFQFLLPGEGDTDYGKYLALLRDARYGGFVCVEVSGQIHSRPGYDPLAAAKTSYANLAPVFAKAGLREKR